MIYVSSEGRDGAACGAKPTAACKTIQRGIKRCTGRNCGVLVRYGLYPLGETIQLDDGVSVYGGCVFDNASISHPYRTVLQAPPDGKPAINASGIDAATTLCGLVVLGSDATTPGHASVAMTVASSKGLTISHMTLSSSKGRDGANGGKQPRAKAGQSGSSPDSDTDSGRAGVACPSNPTFGPGNGGVGAEANELVTSGCFLACKCATKDSSASTGQNGQASGDISGGSGRGIGASGCGCVHAPRHTPGNGGKGGDGKSGACGTVGGQANTNVWGTINVKDRKLPTWQPVNGGEGRLGSVGSGGGGGGSGGFAVRVQSDPGPLNYDGEPGGGGGGGGCGGSGGLGGQQGGASIALVAVASSLKLIHNVYIPSFGGRGGDGGRGGVGGEGGRGGDGGQGHGDYDWQCGGVWVAGSGGPGGKGGQGGAGAGGAGGNGGPSIGIALVGGSPAPKNADGIYAGKPGEPGSEGQGGQNAEDQCTGVDGKKGLPGGKAPWHSF